MTDALQHQVKRSQPTQKPPMDAPRSARVTFRQIVEANRAPAAQLVWARARLISAMRHAAAASGRRRTAGVLARIKKCAILRVLELLPGQIKVTIDDTFQIGLLSIHWPGHGRMHLPADTQIPIRGSVALS